MTETKLKRKPRISFVVMSASDIGGAVRVAANIANRMCRDCEVHFISVCDESDDSSAFELDSRIVCKTLLYNKPNTIRLRYLIPRSRKPFVEYITSSGIEVVFLVGSFTALVGYLPSLQTSCRYVFCDHGALANQLDSKSATAIRRLAWRRFDRTVVLTERTRSDYVSIFKASREKIVCIPNWIDSQIISQRKPYNAASKKILWAGRLDKEKGADMLLDIAERVLPQCPDWVWDVYGAPVMSTDGGDFAFEISARGLEGRLNYLGVADDLVSKYGDYACCTLTSYREGLPMVLLEAKASGLPLISFDVVTGPNEIIDHGLDGYLVPCFDCDAYASRVLELVKDPSLRVRFSQASQKGMERFSEEGIYALWWDLINSII